MSSRGGLASQGISVPENCVNFVPVASKASLRRRMPLGRVCLLASVSLDASSDGFAHWAAVARVVAFGSVISTLQIKIFCVFIDRAAKLQYKYQ